jgi:hypothetical protein
MLHPQTDAASGAGTDGGRRPTVVPAPLAASPELADRPRRRTFTAQDKLRILAETDRATEHAPGLVPEDRWYHRDPASRGSLLLQPYRLAPGPGRRGHQRAEPGQARAEACPRAGKPDPRDRRTQPAGRRQRPSSTGQCPPHAAPDPRRSRHRHPKKVAALLGIPMAPSDNAL